MKLVLAEKPSVAQSIAKVLGAAKREDGYLEGNGYVVSWCVGHLVELAQPEAYDAKYSKWAYADLPIFPMDWQYEVSAGTRKQFGILKKLMAREDVASIVCATDAGREGELIFRLVYHKAGCRKPFERLWISSMEDVAIKEGFENLRSGTEYDALYEAALCRERADWIVGINATRLFSTLYGQTLNVGRVMTPTLAMAVMREAAISAFKPELFYTVQIGLDGFTAASERFKTKAAAEAVKQSCSVAIVQKAECKEKTEKPPALYDLTSLQREANRVLGYTAQQTLDYTQNLYEKKLVTYPRTDARVLSTAAAKEIYKNISGLRNYEHTAEIAQHIIEQGNYKNLAKTRYVNDKQITDHYAIVPTGQGLNALRSVSLTAQRVYETIVRRFVCIFYPPAVYQKISLVTKIQNESFFSSFKVLLDEGYLKVATNSFAKRKAADAMSGGNRAGAAGNEGSEEEDPDTGKNGGNKADDSAEDMACDTRLLAALQNLKKGDILSVDSLSIKEGETSPPKRYNSGSMILAMENAGQLIEDEELRAQIKSCGIGTSATRAEILKKLCNIKYLALNKKTQVITPTLLGEMIFDVVNCSIRQLLNPELTASWEKGLNYVAEGSITEQEYMDKLEHFVRLRTRQVEDSNIQPYLRQFFDAAAVNYKDSSEKNSAKTTGRSTSATGRSRTCRKPSASK